MNKEYAIYPFRYMNITQRHDEGNHGPHSINATNYSDKPWDEACQDGGRSYFEPQNDFIVEEVLGLNGITTNSVRLKSVNKLFIPYKDESDYLYVTLTHMNEDNLKEVKVGQTLRKGSRILLEGTDGNATGNHFHVTANLGKYYGLLQNNNGKWCYTYDKSLLPNEAFYLDKNWTQVIYAKEYAFQLVPVVEAVGTIVSREENVDQIEVKVPELYCRTVPNKGGEILGFTRPGLHNYIDKVNADGYDWYNIGIGWIAYTSEWCNLYPRKVEQEIEETVSLPKIPNSKNNKENGIVIPNNEKDTDTNDDKTNIIKNKKENIFLKLIKMFVNLLKKIISG